jgi:hypothetical protein
VRTNVREGEDAAVAMGRPATVPPPAPNPVAAPAPAAAVAQVPPETVVEKPKPASSPARNVANPAAAAIPEKPFVWPVIKITAVIGAQQGKSLARINGRLVSQGDRIESLTVEAIAPQCVTLVAGTGERRDFYVGANR